MNTGRIETLKKELLEEESIAHIKGWDFSHIDDRYNEEEDLPWEYEDVINYALTIGVSKAFIQEGDTALESFIPDFNVSVLNN